MAELEYPDALRYSSDHEWVAAQETAGVYRVGVTAFAQDSLGEVVYVDVPAVGDEVSAGETCGEVESTKSVSDLIAPLSGTVTAVNDELDGSPELINSAPYADGWLYEVEIGDAAEVDQLLDAAAYRATLS